MIYPIEQIEQAFIGSLIVDNNNVILAIDIVKPGDFKTKAAAISYSTILKMFSGKKSINLQTFLIEQDLIEHFEYLCGASDIGMSTNCERLGSQIAENGRKARISERIKRIKPENDSAETLAKLKEIYTEEISGGPESGCIKKAFTNFDERVKENMERGSLGIRTGFTAFEQLGIEYEPGQLWVAGGYTNVGKTSLMIEMILRAGLDKKIAIHSTEMKTYQLIARLIAGLSGVSHKSILRGKRNSLIDSAREEVEGSNIKIYDTNRDFDKMWNQCRKDKLQDGLDLIFADYFQNFKRKGQIGYELYAGMGKDSLEIPQEIDATLVMFAQITGTENKEDSGGVNYKGAGELGESCDIGLWLKKSTTIANSILVEHRKNRHGAKKDFLLTFQGESNRMEEVG